MELSKVQSILKVCKLVDDMPSGGGWVRPAEIIKWSSVSHATTYRYLKKLTKLGLLSERKQSYREGVVYEYAITGDGAAYLNGFKEMKL